MTLLEAKKLNFPLSWHQSAQALRDEYGDSADMQHDIFCWWYRLGDGQIRWKSYYLEDAQTRKDRYI